MKTLEYTDYKYTDKSSVFRLIAYNFNTKELYVVFRANDDTWKYSQVSDSVWQALTVADSAGSYYNQYISGKFPSTLIGQYKELSWDSVERQALVTICGGTNTATATSTFTSVAKNDWFSSKPPRYTVVGTAGTGEFEFTCHAIDEDAALRAFDDHIERLNFTETVKVTAVTHHFE